jgi:hypothetical protein
MKIYGGVEVWFHHRKKYRRVKFDDINYYVENLIQSWNVSSSDAHKT